MGPADGGSDPLREAKSGDRLNKGAAWLGGEVGVEARAAWRAQGA